MTTPKISQRVADVVGNDLWSSDKIVFKVMEELGELVQAFRRKGEPERFDEYGDLCFAVVCLGLRNGWDVEEAVAHAVRKHIDNLKITSGPAVVEHVIYYGSKTPDGRLWPAEFTQDAPNPPRCPSCGYSWRDAAIHGDHHLCFGVIPGRDPRAPAVTEDAEEPVKKCELAGQPNWPLRAAALLNVFQKVFLGDCMGVGLEERGQGDPHVCFVLLIEDDEVWAPIRANSVSGHWLIDLQEQIVAAREWCNDHCIAKGTNCWEFKTN